MDLEWLNQYRIYEEPLEQLLLNEQFTFSEISELGIGLVQKYQNIEETDKISSSQFYEDMKCLIMYGLDPNQIIDGNNVMEELRYVPCGYEAPDVLNLMLEAGGKWDLDIDGERLFDMIDEDIVCGADYGMPEEEYDLVVHLWLVLLGHGARLKNGNLPVELLSSEDSFDISAFVQHRNFTWKITGGNGTDEWRLHIYDRDGLERARL